MKKRGALLILFLVLIMHIGFVSASFSSKNYDIDKTYNTGESIKGWINISFENESADSEISASKDFSGKIKLKDFLDKNLVEYDCVPKDCEVSYKTDGSGLETKSFSLSGGEEKVMGFKLTGKIDDIISLSFNLNIDNELSCRSPLSIDIFSDDIEEWKAEELSESYKCAYKEKGDVGMGCYEDSKGEESRIGNNMYCEKIKLIKNKKFRLGAWLKGDESTTWYNGMLVMYLYDMYGTELGSCDLPKPSLEGGEVSCEIELDDYYEGEHFVCLGVEENTYYKIKRESNEPCGFYGYNNIPPNEYKFDYSIFAKGARFSKIGEITFNQEEYENQGNTEELAYAINRYITERYNKDCSAGGCIVPIKFKAKTNMNIEISDISLEYHSDGEPKTEKKVYDVKEESAKISSECAILDLGLSNITVPSKKGNYSFMLYLNNEGVLDKDIEINVVSNLVIENLVPRFVPAAVPTKFKIQLKKGANISTYKWDFGDNSAETTTDENFVTHTYSEKGVYNLKIEVEDVNGFVVSRIFSIEVGSPRKVAGRTIKKYKFRLDNLTSQIALLPSWYKDKVKEIIGLENLISGLKNLEQKYNSSEGDDDYIKIMRDLTEMRVPYLIKTMEKEKIPFFIDVDSINLKYFKQLGAGSYNDTLSDSYRTAIVSWSENNLNYNLEFKYVIGYYDESVENLLGVFELGINPAKEEDKEFYIVIGNKNVVFEQQLNVKDLDNAVGIKFSDIKQRTIKFAVPNIEVEDLQVYFSPSFSLLNIAKKGICNFNGVCEEGEDWKNCRADCKPWGIAGILIVLVLFGGLIAYIFLQWWYKKNYEKYLFKNRNDLYNISEFIKNGKSQGLSDSKISDELKKSGWNSEQINYAFKKLRGKAIMPFDFLKLFKKFEREKLKRQQPSGKRMFIQRHMV